MPVSLAEKGITLEELHERSAQSTADLDHHLQGVARMKKLIGDNYDRGGAVSDRQREKELTTAADVYKEFKLQGDRLAARMDEPVILPEVPTILLDPESSKVISDAKLRPIVIPSFTGLDRGELSKIEDGKPSRFDNVLPRPYLEGVAKGEFPLPHKDPYVLFVDSAVDSGPDSKKLTTPLASGMGLDNLAHTPIAEVRAKVRKQSADALKSLGMDSGDYSVRPVSAREAGLVAVVKNQKKEVVTNTRVFGTDQHVVFGNNNIRLTDGTQNGVPPRLTIATRGLQPDQYVPSRNRRAARAK